MQQSDWPTKQVCFVFKVHPKQPVPFQAFAGGAPGVFSPVASKRGKLTELIFAAGAIHPFTGIFDAQSE
jgi:hypothetical protein